eukprot:Hpha_TRINITY_DN16978_c0_g4::TRINITY_DN16978_c0_g4_i1::g.53635::m.53635
MGKGIAVTRSKSRLEIKKLNEERGKPTRAKGRAVDSHKGGGKTQKKRKNAIEGKNSGEEAIHPKSRKAKQLWKAFNKGQNKVKRMSEAEKVGRARQIRWKWFQSRVAELPTDALLVPQAEALVVEHVKRNDAELEELAEKRVRLQKLRNRLPPPTGREKLLQGTRETEARMVAQREFEVPLMTSKAGLRQLREWDGAWEALKSMAVIKFHIPGGVDAYQQFTLGKMAEKKKKERVNVKLGTAQAERARQNRIAAVGDLQSKRRAQLIEESRGRPGPFASPPRDNAGRKKKKKKKSVGVSPKPDSPFSKPETSGFAFQPPTAPTALPDTPGAANPFLAALGLH